MTGSPRVMELVEYQTKELALDELDLETAQEIWRRYGSQISVEEPGFKNGYRWRLTSQGWVGQIPVSPELHLVLAPKVPVANLFGMLEHAYKVGEFLPGLVNCDSLQELYERLASVLAKRILDRGRKGFYRSYESRQEQTPYVRGRLDSRRLAAVTWDTRLHCYYEELTADIEDNQILAWTLFTIARSGICGGQTLSAVRTAFHQLAHVVAVERFNAASCLNRMYHRLNEDYRSLHALSRFFLENSGPSHQVGDHTMLPFLIDMDRLFEVFVAEWLIAKGPEKWRVDSHHTFIWDRANALRSDVDIVLRDRQTGQPVIVLDTKYKTGESPDPGDVQQVVFYALALGCQEAALVYPTPLTAPLNTLVGGIHVRTLAFALDGNLDTAGRDFSEQLLL